MRALAAILLLLLAGVVHAGPAAFVDVTVLPMEGEARLAHRTVIVRDGRIEAITDADAPLPAGCTRIDGRGRFLLPGLCDMHVHHWYEEEQVLFLANGVTTVRNLWGTPQHLRWARAIADGARPGPRIVTSGPLLDGPDPVWQGSVVVGTADEARAEVRRQAAAGYDAVKLYNRLAPDVAEAIVDEARAVGLRVAGHVPWALGIDRLLALRPDSIEHLEGYFRYSLAYDAERTAALAATTAELGVWNVPTLIVYERFVPAEEARALLQRPEMRFVPPRLRATWDPARDFRLKAMSAEQFEAVRRGDEVRRRIVRALHAAGAPLMAGTDTGNPFVPAGFALHDELARLVEAGLAPAEALACATRAPARYLGLEDETGTVAEGRRADLLLLEQDPLAAIGNTRAIAGVMAAGRWYPRATLDAMLEEVAASYERPVDRFRGRPEPAGPVALAFVVTWNGLPVGAERFAAVTHADGSRSLHVQQVNDPPAGTFRDARIRWGADGELAEVRIEREGPGGTDARRFGPADLPGDGVATSGFLVDWWMLAPRLLALDRGGEWTFLRREPPDGPDGAWGGARVTVRREAGEADRAVFALRFEEEDGTVEGTLVLDADGRPWELRTTLQQGVVRFARR